MNKGLFFVAAVAVTVLFMAKRQSGVLEEIVVTSQRRPTNDFDGLEEIAVTSTRRPTNDFEGPYAVGKSPSELGLYGPGDG